MTEVNHTHKDGFRLFVLPQNPAKRLRNGRTDLAPHSILTRILYIAIYARAALSRARLRRRRRDARASAVTALGGADDRTSRSYPPPTGSGRLRITAGALPSAGFRSGLLCRRAPRVRGLRLARGQLAYVRADASWCSRLVKWLPRPREVHVRTAI